MTSPLSLLTRQGQRLLERLAGEEADPARALGLAESLRGSYPPDLVAAALTQQALRARARAKFSRADAMLFTRAGLEQASSELAAAHSAARYPEAGLVADLCCGIGGNLSALAAGRRAVAVDRDPVSAAFARHNAAVYGAAGAAVVCADVRDLVPAGRPAGPAQGRPAQGRVTGVFIDPARRAGGHRLRAGLSEPPLDFCLSLASQIPAVGIKTAPGLPHELAPPSWEIEFVAIGRSLKEALLWSPALATNRRRATVLHAAPRQDHHGESGQAPRRALRKPEPGPAGQHLAAGLAGRHSAPGPAGRQPEPGPEIPLGDTLVSAAGPQVPVAPPGAFLLDPNPAVTRAGLVQDLARELGAWQIDPMIAFLSADAPLRTPFARTLRILDSAPWHEKHFARRLRDLDIGTADIRRRGLAGDVDQIRRRLGLQGQRSATIVITRQNEKPWGLICTEPDDATTNSPP
jgi:SAM-dependent methyltransferase